MSTREFILCQVPTRQKKCEKLHTCKNIFLNKFMN